MTAYKYQAIDVQGRVSKGVIQAESVKQACLLLKDQGLIPINVEASKSTSSFTLGLGSSKASFSKLDLTVWTRQLASLLSAGLSVQRSLESLVRQSKNPKVTSLLTELTNDVKAGNSFSSALSKHPHDFDNVFCGVVAAGEASGSLPSVLLSLADGLEASQALKSKVVGAALYPAIVSCIAILIVVFLMIYVLPQVAQAFEGSKQSLPLLTVIMLSTSAFLKDYWIFIIAFIALAITAFKLAMRSHEQQKNLDARILRVPVIGELIRNYNAARFSATLGMLCGAGVPILDALNAAAKTVSNLAMKDDIAQVTILVKEGAPLSKALGMKQSIPDLVATFAGIGSETGNLSEMMNKVGTQLSAEVQRRSMALSSTLEPILILSMGVVVMLIVLAVLMPMIQMNSFVS